MNISFIPLARRPNSGEAQIAADGFNLATVLDAATPDDLGKLICCLTRDPRLSFGADIDAAELVLLGNASVELKTCTLMQWLSRNSPCLFGRLGAKRQKGVDFPVCWLEAGDLDRGARHVTSVIQAARREWKELASRGLSSAFLVMFNDERLARAKPDAALVDLLCLLGGLYFVEAAPIRPDVIYTEAVPLIADSASTLFRAGANFFYPTAHETLNHDRRVPGGVLISVNSPGHLANSWVSCDLSTDLEMATCETRKLAIKSVGRGGIGSSTVKSCSWHNLIDGRVSDLDYSAVYHTDVLVPSAATAATHADNAQVWDDLKLDYISTEVVPPDHRNYALYHGHPVAEGQLFDNPWPPRDPHTLEDIDTRDAGEAPCCA